MSGKPFGWTDASHDIVQVGGYLGTATRALDAAIEAEDWDRVRRSAAFLRRVLTGLDTLALKVATNAAEFEPAGCTNGRTAAELRAEITRLEHVQPADCDDDKWDARFARLRTALARAERAESQGSEQRPQGVVAAAGDG